uniref:Nicotinamide-nucleotide adenylyltransferase n=1 Tax=Timema poppense TaxID=170557 RepID=A0A7R9H747_TIMPO|nr:unnamed protein product [Timema poppensis]
MGNPLNAPKLYFWVYPCVLIYALKFTHSDLITCIRVTLCWTVLIVEIARDHLQRTCYHTVIGGIISPVHDGYGKKDLESATHRCNMTRLALQSSDWIRLSEWECHQDTWSRTKVVMQYHQCPSGGFPRIPPHLVLCSVPLVASHGYPQHLVLCSVPLVASHGYPRTLSCVVSLWWLPTELCYEECRANNHGNRSMVPEPTELHPNHERHSKQASAARRAPLDPRRHDSQGRGSGPGEALVRRRPSRDRLELRGSGQTKTYITHSGGRMFQLATLAVDRRGDRGLNLGRIETIVGQHGLVVITRNGSNPYKFIYESDILTKYQNNIHIVTEWITNDVSSTKIRRALRRSESVKYLLVDPVIDYINKQGLYNTKETWHIHQITSECGTGCDSSSPADISVTNIH